MHLLFVTSAASYTNTEYLFGRLSRSTCWVQFIFKFPLCTNPFVSKERAKVSKAVAAPAATGALQHLASRSTPAPAARAHSQLRDPTSITPPLARSFTRALCCSHQLFQPRCFHLSLQTLGSLIARASKDFVFQLS